MRMLMSSRALRQCSGAMLVTALVLSSCGGSSDKGFVLSEVAYLKTVKRSCLIAKQAVEEAGSEHAAPAVHLRRAAAAAEAMQRGFVKVRPPVRFAAAHREALRLGKDQLGLILTAIDRLQRGEMTQALADLQARNHQLQQRGNQIADELGVPECVNDLGGS